MFPRMARITFIQQPQPEEIALEGLDHMIARPQEISVVEGVEGQLESIEIVGADRLRQIVKLKRPAQLSGP